MPIIDPGYVAMSGRHDDIAATDITAKSNQSNTSGIATERKASFDDVAALIAAENEWRPAVPAAKPAQSGPSFKFWQKEDFGFGDLVDIVNPLQHIPIVSTLYRHWTGDQIGPAPRVIGGALWGRAGGLVAGLINSVVEWFTGKDVGDHIYAKLFGAPKTSANTTVAVQGKTPRSVSEKNAAAVISAPVRELVPRGMDDLPAVIEARAASESTLRNADRKSAGVVPETNRVQNPPAIAQTPWPAASALHIFQKHDRSGNGKEASSAPTLRYIA